MSRRWSSSPHPFPPIITDTFFSRWKILKVPIKLCRMPSQDLALVSSLSSLWPYIPQYTQLRPTSIMNMMARNEHTLITFNNLQNDLSNSCSENFTKDLFEGMIWHSICKTRNLLIHTRGANGTIFHIFPLNYTGITPYRHRRTTFDFSHSINCFSFWWFK